MRCSFCRTRAATHASRPLASSSCSASRTAASGTTTRSSRAGARSSARCPFGIPARTSCRRRSLHYPEPTDWTQIALLYGRLAELSPSPVVELNRAVAVGLADGPEAGLALLDAIEG